MRCVSSLLSYVGRKHVFPFERVGSNDDDVDVDVDVRSADRYAVSLMTVGWRMT